MPRGHRPFVKRTDTLLYPNECLLPVAFGGQIPSKSSELKIDRVGSQDFDYPSEGARANDIA